MTKSEGLRRYQTPASLFANQTAQLAIIKPPSSPFDRFSSRFFEGTWFISDDMFIGCLSWYLRRTDMCLNYISSAESLG